MFESPAIHFSFISYSMLSSFYILLSLLITAIKVAEHLIFYFILFYFIDRTYIIFLIFFSYVGIISSLTVFNN